jgi:hypothetical protein
VDDFSGSQTSDVVLHGADLIEQAQWIEREHNRAQSLLHELRNRLRSQQAGARRLGRMVAFPDPRTDAFLFGQFERRLEKIHEEACDSVEASERFDGGDALEPTVADG